MRKLAFLIAAVVAPAAISAEDQPPAGPFQVIHYFQINTSRGLAEKTMLSAVAALNAGIRKAGCAACIYHLWRSSEVPGWGIAEYELTHVAWP